MHSRMSHIFVLPKCIRCPLSVIDSTTTCLVNNSERNLSGTGHLLGSQRMPNVSNAAGGLFGQYKMMQKNWKWLKPWHMGTHQRELSESCSRNDNNMTELRWFSNIFESVCLGRK